MARTAASARRPPARRVPGASPAVSQQLPPRPSSWGQQATACVAAGVAAFGAAPLLEQPGLAGPGLALGVLAGAARGLHGRREQARQAMADRLAEALAPLLGLRAPDRRAVTLRAWRRGRLGVPRRIDLRYAPGVDDADPLWLPELLQVVERRLLTGYQVHRHDRRRCRLQLVPAALEAQAEPVRALQLRAERTVAELLGPTASVTGVQWDGEDLVGLDVRHEAGAKLSASGYRHRVERVVSTLLPGRWRAQWDLEADTVRFEVRPAFPSSVWLPVAPLNVDRSLLEAYEDLAVEFGVDEDGAVLRWRPTQDPHMIITGTTGSGKTVAAHTLLVQVTRIGVPVWVVDGKGVEFLGFQDWPNVQVVATSVEQQIAVIHRAWELMEYRYELVTSGRARESDFEPLVVVLDEYADFRGNLLDWYAGIKAKGDPTRPAVLAKVGSLGRKGRTARIHLIFGTQRPDQEFFGGAGTSDLRDNLRMRISLGRLSPQGAQMMWNSPAIGTSIPVGCRGRATTINDANQAVEIQTYRTPDPRKVTPGSSEQVLLDQLRPASASHDRLLILPPQVQADLDGQEYAEPRYSDYAAARWVRAAERPDLDPVRHREQESANGRVLSSAMAAFGLHDDHAAPGETADLEPRASTAAPSRSALSPPGASAGAPVGLHDHDLAAGLRVLPAVSAAGVPGEHRDPPVVAARLHLVVDPDDEPEGDADDGYGLPEHCSPAELIVGDLVLVDEDNGTWAVVDQEVEPDLEDPGCVAVSWRSDDDDCGLLLLPDEHLVAVRRPTEPLDDL